MLDKTADLGMITPKWTNAYDLSQGWTSFRLALSPKEPKEKIAAYISEIQPSLLLFLRRLQRLEIKIKLDGSPHLERSLIFRKYNAEKDIVCVEGFNGSLQKYLVAKCLVDMSFNGDEKRPGSTTSEVVLAFQLTQDHRPIIEQQDVHAFLPLRSYGFPVSHFVEFYPAITYYRTASLLSKQTF